MIVLLAFLLATSAWAGTWRDNFDDGEMDEWTVIGNGNSEFEYGQVRLEPLNSGYGFTFGESTWQNYTVSVKMKITEHQSDSYLAVLAGLGLRFMSPESLYLFGLGTIGQSPRQAIVIRMQNLNFFDQSQEAPFEWQLGEQYTLKVIATGNQFQFLVNNVMVLEYVDSTKPAGSIGLAIGTSNIVAYYDDFVLTGDDVPDNVTAVPPKAKLTTTWGRLKNH